MRHGVGIDFGTTNSAVAVYDGDSVTLIALERDGPIMPSATYIDRDRQTSVGQEAIDRYIEGNTGRTVEMIPEVVGETSDFVDSGDAENPSAVETVTTKIYGAAVIDSGLQGRLFRGVKRLLGDINVRRLMVFETAFRLVALITPILLYMRNKVSEQIGAVNYGHLGHPVTFEGRDRFRDKTALGRLAEAYKYAGIIEQHFYPEPIAAAVSFLQANPTVNGETLFTLDFGGGTLDYCILKRRDLHFDVVTTHGIALGGDHIDQLLFRELLFPLLGKGERWRRRGMDREIETRFPFEDYEDLLLNWAITYTLNQNRFTTPVLERIQQGGAGTEKFIRLRDLIQLNLSYLVFQAIKEFKAELSSSQSAVLDIPELDISISMSRDEFERLITDSLNQVRNSLRTTLDNAEMPAEQVDIVLCTGGSSLIPAVRQILEDHFPGKVVEHDPFTSVAAGLAIANYHGW